LALRFSFVVTQPLQQFTRRHLSPATTLYEAAKVFRTLAVLPTPDSRPSRLRDA
jgi:hypothetical protein